MGTITRTLYPRLKIAHLQGHGDISAAMALGNLDKLRHHPDRQHSRSAPIDLGNALLHPCPEQR